MSTDSDTDADFVNAEPHCIGSECAESEPRLPADLERMIFEAAAHDDPATALRLILVTQRARAWIEPLLYHTLLLCQSSWRLPLLLRTLPRAAHWVRALHIAPYIAPNAPCIARALSLCPHVEALEDRSYGRTPLALLVRMRLRRLCIGLDTVDGLHLYSDLDSAKFPLDLAFSVAAFARLTHLHLLDAPSRWGALPPFLARLPSLTYLALNNYKTHIRSANAPALRAILDACPRLRVLAVFVPLYWRPEDENESVRAVVGDARFVILPEGLGARWELWEGAAPTKCIEEGMNEVISYRACADEEWAPNSNPKTRRRNKQTNSKGGLNNKIRL
ncbi:hypothetical protein FB451DRAFT_1526368 [Mycena latifolia]|nr:hypothetical protein FB451DRAFT_1526368 [Mycena latifolia]